MEQATYQVVINEQKCIGCGLCVKDCVAGNLTLKEGKATLLRPSCILCGHCEAICPQNAVTLTGFEDEVVEMEQVRLKPKTLMDAIRTRRTVRRFQAKEVPENVLNDILEAGRLAPTGSNAQNTTFVVLGSKQAELEEQSVKMFRSLTGIAKPLAAYIRGLTIDDDFFFKKAPLVILLAGDKVNASLAAENMAFMAEAHGLGVLYSGFFTICATMNPKIHSALGLKMGEKPVTTLVLGYPAVKYQRTVHRKPAKVIKL